MITHPMPDTQTVRQMDRGKRRHTEIDKMLGLREHTDKDGDTQRQKTDSEKRRHKDETRSRHRGIQVNRIAA